MDKKHFVAMVKGFFKKKQPENELLVELKRYKEIERNLRRTIQELEQELIVSRQMALQDALTGVANRRYFMSRLGEELDRAKREHVALGLIILDVDRFKDINDSFGHLVGDQVLAQLACYLQRGIRSYDFLARIGGEEFAIIVPRAPAQEVKTLAERLLSNLIKKGLEIEDHNIKLSFSAGVASPDPEYLWNTNTEEVINFLLSEADSALYEAKRQGRSRVYQRTNCI